MDTLTQAALGATVAQAGFGRRLGRRAVWVGALLGALPDFDVLSGLFGPWASMVHHRGATHSLLFAPLAAPLLGLLAWRLLNRRRGGDAPGRDRRDLLPWMHLAFWALITHPLLDWCTSYGTQLLWPLTNARYAIDAVMIVDPIYSLVLLAALVTGWAVRKRPRVGQLAGAIALVLTTGYLSWGYVQSRQARQLAAAQLRAEGFDPVRVRAQPQMLLWMWRIVARDRDGDLRVGVVSTWKPTPMVFQRIDRPADPLVERALQSDRGRTFAWFADDMIGFRFEQHRAFRRVYLDDQRYGLVTDPARAFWGAYADFDNEGALLRMDRYRERPTDRMRSALAAAWYMMWNGVATESRAARQSPNSPLTDTQEPAHHDASSLQARAAL